MGTRQWNPQSDRLCILQKFYGTLRHSFVIIAVPSVCAPPGIASRSTVPLVQLCSQNVEPVGKRFLLAVDISTSLSSIIPGTAVSTAVAAAAISMVRLGPLNKSHKYMVCQIILQCNYVSVKPHLRSDHCSAERPASFGTCVVELHLVCLRVWENSKWLNLGPWKLLHGAVCTKLCHRHVFFK